MVWSAAPRPACRARVSSASRRTLSARARARAQRPRTTQKRKIVSWCSPRVRGCGVPVAPPRANIDCPGARYRGAAGTLEVVVHDETKVVDGRIASALLRYMRVTHPERCAPQGACLERVLDVEVSLAFVEQWGVDPGAVHVERISAQAFRPERREIVCTFDHDRRLVGAVEVLHLHAGVAREAAPGTDHVRTAAGARVGER